MIRIDTLSFRRGATPVLQDLSLTLPRGGVTALIGPNGAGKSTLLALIARLLPRQHGRITLDDLDVHAAPGPVLARKLAILRQETHVSVRLTVREIVALGRFPHSRGRLTPEDHRLIDATLAQFDLTALADRFIDALSGGQKQRVLLAMAVCQGTDYLLLDEPLNNLDIAYARQFMQHVRRLADDHGRTVIIVMHDLNQSAAWADRIIALKDGRIVADGAPAAVLTPPILQDLYGCTLQVEIIGGRPVIL